MACGASVPYMNPLHDQHILRSDPENKLYKLRAFRAVTDEHYHISNGESRVPMAVAVIAKMSARALPREAT